MYLHLGGSVSVPSDDVVGIFDLDTSTISKRTRDTLRRAELEGRVINVSSDLPKSFVVKNEKKPIIYISQISASTLKKRSGYIDDIKNI